MYTPKFEISNLKFHISNLKSQFQVRYQESIPLTSRRARAPGTSHAG
jgi:hypothetical protein